MKKIKVLVVDDSLLFREFLVRVINSIPQLMVVAACEDVFQARDAILKFHPDVVTCDVSMPRMDGIEFVRQLLPQYKIPVIMVSSFTGKVFDALEAGAVDFVNKPAMLNDKEIEKFVKNELASKIIVAASVKFDKNNKSSMPVNSRTVRPVNNTAPKSGAFSVLNRISSGKNVSDRIVAIGASTGGTEAILKVVKGFNPDIPGVVIVQHMPVGFTSLYAERLDRCCNVRVKEAKSGDRVEKGLVLIAPGDVQMKLSKDSNGYFVVCGGTTKVSGHCPSVDFLFKPVAETAKDKAIGVILTGMGADGAAGLLQMRSNGALTIGQNQQSCVVYGMPKVAYDIGAVKYQLDINEISTKVYALLNL